MTLIGSSTVSVMARALKRVPGDLSATLNSTLQAIQLPHLIQILLQIQIRRLTHLQQSMCILMAIATISLMVHVPLCRTVKNARGLIL